MQIDYPAFIPTDEESTEVSVPITKDEIEEALRSMQADSTPGLTGTTRNFLLWLLTVITKIFVEGYNDYILNHTGDSAFHWVKMRKIVFLPKIRKPKNKMDSYRPISLLEVFYKIGTKFLIKRVGKTVTERISRKNLESSPPRWQLKQIPIYKPSLEECTGLENHYR